MKQMRAAKFRSELFVEEMPAPQRIAPFASALSADVTVEGEDVGSGRIVVLHDPAGNDAWHGTFRCVAYARAEIDPELVSDPLLAGVGWSWLTEALEAHGATYAVPVRQRHLRQLRELRRDGRRARHRPARDPRLVVADRRPHPPRRGVGRAAVHRGRTPAGARGRGHDALPTRTTWRLMSGPQTDQPEPTDDTANTEPADAASAEPEKPPSRRRPC